MSAGVAPSDRPRGSKILPSPNGTPGKVATWSDLALMLRPEDEALAGRAARRVVIGATKAAVGATRTAAEANKHPGRGLHTTVAGISCGGEDFEELRGRTV